MVGVMVWTITWPGVAAAAAGSESLFPFSLPADAVTEGVTDLSFLNDKPANEPVTVRDGHFYAGGKRIRFWTCADYRLLVFSRAWRRRRWWPGVWPAEASTRCGSI